MKQGMSLTQALAQAQVYEDQKRDFIDHSSALWLDESLMLNHQDHQYLSTDQFHRGVADRFQIPWKHYDRLAGQYPDLLATHVNALMERDDKMVMVRAMQPEVGAHVARAMLSDRYKRIDNGAVLGTALTALMDTRPDVTIRSMNVGRDHLHLKVIFSEIQAEVAVGVVVASGIVIENNEVGKGAFSIYPWLEELACTNGMKVGVSGVRKTHLGAAYDSPGILQADTEEAINKAIMLQVRDFVKSMSTDEGFDNVVGLMREAAHDEIEGDPVECVQLASKKFRLTEEESNRVIRYFLQTEDMTRLGLSRGITRAAEDCDSYDRASEMEEIGGDVITLDRKAWRAISKAA